MTRSIALLPVVCFGLLVLAVNSRAIKRQQQLQNLQNQPISVMAGQSQGGEQLQQGMQSAFGQPDQSQNSISNLGFGQQQQQQPMSAFGGSAEALMNLLQQLLLQQHMTSASQQSTPNFGNGQAWPPSQQFAQQPSPTDQNPLMALLGGSNGMPQGPPPVPPPTGAAFGNGGMTGGLPPPLPPPIATNSVFGLPPPQQPDQINANASTGAQGVGVNPPQPLQYSPADNGSSNLANQLGNVMNGK